MDDVLRAFIAIELPESIVRSMGKLQESLKSDGLRLRWVKTGSIHLTLKFLGDIAATETAKIQEVMAECAGRFAPMSLSAKGIGVFPDLKRPRVMWVGLSGHTEQLLRLQKAIEENLATLGYPEEKRVFKAHLTLGRVKGRMDSAALLRAMRTHAGFASEAFVADRIILFKSQLKPSGAVYSKLAQVALCDQDNA